MSEHHNHTPNKPFRDETSLNITGVYQFLGWLLVLMIFTYGLVYGIVKWNDSRTESATAVTTHLPKTKGESLPPEPRLQLAPGHSEHPLAEGIRYRDSVVKDLESYGYVNKEAGLVRIPIELAKDLLLKKGLPVRANAAAVSFDQQVPQASSSGRTTVDRDNRVPGGTYTVTGGNLNVTAEKSAQ